MSTHTPEMCVLVARETAKKLMALSDPLGDLHTETHALAAEIAARTVEGLLGAGMIKPGKVRHD